MSGVFAGVPSDDFIPDLDWDGTATTSDDLKNYGGFVEKRGYYHLDLRERTLIQKDGEPAHVKLMFVVEAGEHADQVGKQVSHRLYRQKWEYELDPNGKPVEEEKETLKGKKYKAKKKTGRILPLEPDDFASKQAIKFFVGVGLLTEEQSVGKRFKLPFSQLNPGMQCIALVDAEGQISYNTVYTLDNPEVEAVPKNEELVTRWKAGIGAGGMNDDVISSL